MTTKKQMQELNNSPGCNGCNHKKECPWVTKLEYREWGCPIYRRQNNENEQQKLYKKLMKSMNKLAQRLNSATMQSQLTQITQGKKVNNVIKRIKYNLN